MKASDILWTFGLMFFGILGLNLVIRMVLRGFDATLDFSPVGIAIAAGIAVLVTIGEADRQSKRANGQS